MKTPSPILVSVFFCALVFAEPSDAKEPPKGIDTAYLLETVETTRQRFIQHDLNREKSVQKTKTAFKFIREVDEIRPPLPYKKGLLPLRMSTVKDGAIATLHRPEDGEPLQSCVTPCDLYGDADTDYVMIFSQKGHVAKSYEANSNDWSDDMIDIHMGTDFFKVLEETRSCILEYSNSIKKDSDAELCVHIPTKVSGKRKTDAFCKIEFDVEPTGYPRSIEIIEHNNEDFAQACRQAMTWFFYKPKTKDGRPVWDTGLSLEFHSTVTDELGNPIQ